MPERRPYRDQRGFYFSPVASVEVSDVTNGDEIRFSTGMSRTSRYVVMQVVEVVPESEVEFGMFEVEIRISRPAEPTAAATEAGRYALWAIGEGVPTMYLDESPEGLLMRPRMNSLWLGRMDGDIRQEL